MYCLSPPMTEPPEGKMNFFNKCLISEVLHFTLEATHFVMTTFNSPVVN